MCHDEHSCSVSVGDDWLRQTVGMIMQSQALSNNGVLFITWDEDDGSAANRLWGTQIHMSLEWSIDNPEGWPVLDGGVSCR
jgi:hypothetical protein